MRNILFYFLLSVTPLFTSILLMAESREIYHFPALEQKQEFESLIQNSRCLVCQNQSLADSDASLAKDLRNDIYRLVLEKKNEQEIQTYLTQRYGRFILLKPPLNSNTFLLWFGPFLLLLSGFIILYRLQRRSR